MSKLTRYFLFGSVAILIIGLSIGVVAYYNGGLKAIASSGPSQLRFVPADAAVVAYADVRQIMSSNFRQRVKQLEGDKHEAGQQEFRDQTGIDIEHDIDSVIAYMTTDATQASHAGVVIAEGRFDQARISNFVKQKGGTVGEYAGKPFMTFSKPDKSESVGALAFLGGNQVAIGSNDAVQRTLDVAMNKGTSPDVTHNEKMMGMIGDVDRGTAWVVGRFDALSNKAHLPPQVASQIPPISWFSASTDIDGGIKGQLSVEASDQQAAANLKSVVEGLKGLAGLQARSSNVPTQLQQMLNSLQLEQGGPDNNRLTLRFSLPADVLDALTALGSKAKK